jgi:hypothetical protein
MAIILTDADTPTKAPMQRTPPGFLQILLEHVTELSAPKLSRFLGPVLYGPDNRRIDTHVSGTIHIKLPERYRRHG